MYIGGKFPNDETPEKIVRLYALFYLPGIVVSFFGGAAFTSPRFGAGTAIGAFVIGAALIWLAFWIYQPSRKQWLQYPFRIALILIFGLLSGTYPVFE